MIGPVENLYLSKADSRLKLPWFQARLSSVCPKINDADTESLRLRSNAWDQRRVSLRLNTMSPIKEHDPAPTVC